MKFISVCSGIEAASATSRACSKCAAVKPLTEFHKQPSGPGGRHSWCKPCANAGQKASREKNGRPTAKRKWNLSTRYGLSEAAFAAMVEQQGGRCGICAQAMGRPHIDHDHATGKVRALLCHACNVALGHVERKGFLTAAMAYLEKHK